MEIELRTDELKMIKSLLLKKVRCYEYKMEYAEDQGHYEYLCNNREIYLKEYQKFVDFVNKACEETGEETY